MERQNKVRLQIGRVGGGGGGQGGGGGGGGGGRGPGAVVFLDVSFALMPLQTYPMFLLDEQ